MATPDEDEDDPLDVTEGQEQVTCESLGLKQKCEKNHQLHIIFHSNKLIESAKAVNPKQAADNMTAYIDRIIGFVEKRSKTKVDHWDTLRDSKAHECLIRNLKNASDCSESVQLNFKKAADTLLKWCDPQTGARGRGRLLVDRKLNQS